MIDLSRRRPFRSVSVSDNLHHIMELLARGAHRVAVLDDSGKAVKIVSQSSVIQFLSKNVSFFIKMKVVERKMTEISGRFRIWDLL